MLPAARNLFVYSFLCCSLAFGAMAQDGAGVAPQIAIPVRPKPPAKDAAAEVLPKSDIRINSNLVLIPVTVNDSLNRFVTGLDKENFKIFEDKTEQTITQFSSEDAPLSVGIIFDCSGSMGHKMEKARQAVSEFFKTANPDDEGFLVQFNDSAKLIEPLTKNLDEIQNRLTFS